MKAEKRRSIRIRTKLIFAFSFLAVVSAGIFSLIVFAYIRHQTREEFRESLLRQVTIAALQINGDLHSTLKTRQDEESPAYEQILQTLQDIQATNPDLSFPYTVRFDQDGKVQFIVDSTDPDPAGIGESYPHPGPVLQEGPSAVTGPAVEADLYTDEWGVWLSGYAPIYRSDHQQDGVLVFDVAADRILENERQLAWIVLLAFLSSLVIALGLALFLANRLTQPVHSLQNMALQVAGSDLPDLSNVAKAVASGDLSQTATLPQRSISVTTNDELGDLARALNEMVEQVGLTGQSLNEMTQNLNQIVSRVSVNAQELEQASGRLSANSDNVQHGMHDIVGEILHASENMDHQAQFAAQTADSVEKMTQLISNLAKGAQQQSEAVQTVSAITGQIVNEIGQISQNAALVIKDAAQAGALTQRGVSIVNETIQRMQTIRSQVNFSTQKVEKMGKHSESIEAILDTIEDISSQTNLLALNAAIETARAESQAEILIDTVLNHQMIAQAQLLNQVLLDHQEPLSLAFWSELVQRAGMSSISITNADGVVVYSNEPEVLGWRFPEDPHAQAYAFRKLIGQTSGVVCQKAQQRSSDGKSYKYVGISRLDKPGIVQIAYDAERLQAFEVNLGSFGVVAEEVRKLAERSSTSSKEIGRLVKDIQKTVAEAVEAMNASAGQVATGSDQSKDAGQSLESILMVVESVSQQAKLAAQAVEKAKNESNRLVNAMQSVSSVIAENQQMAEQMAVRSEQMAKMVCKISEMSQTNMTVVEKVQANSEEVSDQAQEVATSAHYLAEMSGHLRMLVAGFTIQGKELPKNK